MIRTKSRFRISGKWSGPNRRVCPPIRNRHQNRELRSAARLTRIFHVGVNAQFRALRGFSAAIHYGETTSSGAASRHVLRCHPGCAAIESGSDRNSAIACSPVLPRINSRLSRHSLGYSAGVESETRSLNRFQ